MFNRPTTHEITDSPLSSIGISLKLAAFNPRAAIARLAAGALCFSALGLASCVSTPDQLRDRIIWVYSPNHDGQPMLIAVDAPSAASQSSATAARGEDQLMAQHQSEQRRLHTDRELPKIANLIASRLSDRKHDEPSIASLLSEIAGSGGSPETSVDTSFPSQIIVLSHSCRTPNSDTDRFAIEHLCRAGADRYEELVIQDFSHWNSFTDVVCRDCVAKFMARQSQFTLESLTALLMTSGYQSIGVVQKQQFEHGFSTPFVYSGFIRDNGPLIAVGAKPQQTSADGKQTSSVRELRLFFSTRG